MSDSVTVVVTIESSTRPAPPSPPHHRPGGNLPATGLATGVLLAVAFGLLVAGRLLTRHTTPQRRRRHMRSRPAYVLVGLLLVAAAAAPALGDSESTTVSLSTAGPGTRQLDLLDLAGSPLTELPLAAGVPTGFRVRITDNEISDLTTGFSVSAVMSNLYRWNGSSHVWTDKVASADVALSYPANPYSSLGLSYDVLPKVNVTGTLPNCTSLTTLLGLSLTALTDSGLCTIVGTVSGSYTLPVAVTVPAAVEALVSGAIQSPYALTGNETGNFATPDYSVGIGATAVGNDPAAVANQTGSPRQVMVGAFTGIGNLLADINAALATATSGLTGVSATGTGSLTSLPDVLTALSAQGQSALANAVAALPASSQVTLLSEFAFALLQPTVAELTKEVGTYNAFPMLTATPSGTVSTGTYRGTLTVTMVQP